MRILHFAESFSQPTETFIKRFVEKSCDFAEVGVVAFNIHNIDDKLKARIKLFEITERLHSLNTVSGLIKYIAERLTDTRLWHKKLNRAIKTFKPDIIHCHFGNTGVLMMELRRNFKSEVPYVTSFYGYDISSQPELDKKYRDNLTRLWQQGNGFFAEGPALAKKVIALGCPEYKCMVNPLLIPLNDYPVKENYREPGNPVKFLFVGRFIEKKGFQIFLQAMGELKTNIGTFTIDIVGAGPYQAAYDQLIAKYDLQSAIQWHGMVQHNSIITMLKNYDFLVHPSLTAADNDSEGGAPTIIIEAQAIGLPVITTNHADIPYVMGYHNFMAEENDVASLVNNIIKIVNCTDIQFYTQQGRDKVNNQHNLVIDTTYQTNLERIIRQNN